MANKDKFIEEMAQGYTFSGPSVLLGGAMLDGACLPGTQIRIPLKTMNRHGLIAGATGTGKTKSLQMLAEGLAANGVSCLMMDIKGDLSGIAMPGTTNPKIDDRASKIGFTWQAAGHSVEFLTLSAEKGARLRATISEFGPVLFSKILGLNDTQGGVVAVVFKYADDNALPLLDLKDFKKTLNYLGNEGKAEIEQEYGALASTTVSTILRKVVELEQQGADAFFGETSFDVDDLVGFDNDGKGLISIIRLTDIQDRPKLFSSFMLQLLAEIYASFPEQGDAEQPKLCIFIDEAHLVFQEASSALLQQIEAIIKLIRSKGVGVYFITQNPADVPESILAQLGMKIQHSLRAFTAKDRKAIKLAAENYPISEHYNTEDLLIALGIGEALVSVLSERGTPTPLAHTLMCPPASRMDILSPAEIDGMLAKSRLVAKYNREVDSQSAYEILNAKLAMAQQSSQQEAPAGKAESEGQEGGMMDTVSDVMKNPIVRSFGRTLASGLARGLLGVLGVSGTRRRKAGSSWF